MSRLGKPSLYLNLALAIFFAVWGFGLYSNRLDWKTESKDRADQLRKLSAEINKMVPAVEETRSLPVVQDLRRPELDKWYAAQLESLRSGVPFVQFRAASSAPAGSDLVSTAMPARNISALSAMIARSLDSRWKRYCKTRRPKPQKALPNQVQTLSVQFSMNESCFQRLIGIARPMLGVAVSERRFWRVLQMLARLPSAFRLLTHFAQPWQYSSR